MQSPALVSGGVGYDIVSDPKSGSYSVVWCKSNIFYYMRSYSNACQLSNATTEYFRGMPSLKS